MNRPVKITLWIAGIVAALLLILTTAALVILPSAWFREKVRARIVTEIETASGGRAEIGAFNFDWQKLTAEIAPFILHGTEPASEPPLLRVESVKVDLKIVSLFKRDIDIASLIIDRPQVNLIVDANGVSNFPKPKIERDPKKDPVEQLLELAVQTIVIRNGEIRYADKKIPFTLHGERLNASLAYNFAVPSYEGTVKLEQIQLDSKSTLPLSASFDSRLSLSRNKLQIGHARLGMSESFVELTGLVEDFNNIRANFDVNATATLKDLGKPLQLPQPHVGSASFKGKLLYDADSQAQLAGRITGQGLALRQGTVNVQNIALASDVKYAGEQLLLTGLRINALGGSFDGMFQLKQAREFKANGNLNGFTLGELGALGGIKRGQYTGAVSVVAGQRESC
ncbi:MAG: AsmA family protein [Bryobacteraceae bacterium]